MNYEDFVYELITLLKNWGAWENVTIICNNKKYTSCDKPQVELEHPLSIRFDEYLDRTRKYEEKKEKCKFRNLTDVIVDSADKELSGEFEIYIELNEQLNNLFEFGVFETKLEKLPLAKRKEVYYERNELQEAFKEEWDEEDIRLFPESYGIPSSLEFDSSDEYEKFLEEELYRIENDYIDELSGSIEFDNSLEAEICNLCIKYDLSYKYKDGYLFVGYGFF